jgi:hypothetical protein
MISLVTISFSRRILQLRINALILIWGRVDERVRDVRLRLTKKKICLFRRRIDSGKVEEVPVISKALRRQVTRPRSSKALGNEDEKPIIEFVIIRHVLKLRAEYKIYNYGYVMKK